MGRYKEVCRRLHLLNDIADVALLETKCGDILLLWRAIGYFLYNYSEKKHRYSMFKRGRSLFLEMKV